MRGAIDFAVLRRASWALLAAGLAATLVYITYALAQRRALDALKQEAIVTAQLQSAALQSELQRQRIVPTLLAEDSDVAEALLQPARYGDAVSRKLAKLLAPSDDAVIFVIDRNGIARYASNFGRTGSFVGSSFGFRRYFVDGLAKGSAEEFALGSVSRRPGLYIAHRIVRNGVRLGVVVIKVQFAHVEASWRRAGMRTVVTDQSGRILLTSDPFLRFRFLQPLGDAVLTTTLPVGRNGWRVTLATSMRGVREAARSATLIALLAMLLLSAAFAWMRYRRNRIAKQSAAEARYRERLELDVATRTAELSHSNERLSGEIQERQQAERRLNELQANLIQQNKLAQLGQITAGVAHELNQPLATIRLSAEGCLAMLRAHPGSPVAPVIFESLNDVVRMCERITHITGELRTFSRKGSGESGPISLSATLDSSMLLNKSRLRQDRVRLERGAMNADIEVVGGRVRLEQVIVNLLQNAFEAVESAFDPVVRIAVTLEERWAWVRIHDNGPGLAPAIKAKLFTPFVTSKETGLGLGLVIARDIVREYGGDLFAEDAPSGATFALKLKRVI